MTIQQTSWAPSAFVNHLISPGMSTSRGPVPLSQYVSGSSRSPRAASMFALLNGLTVRHRAAAPAGSTPAIEDLIRVKTAIINHSSGPRTSNWRRVFTGQGMPENLVRIWEYILAHREFLCSLSADLRAGEAHPFEFYFSRGNPLPSMIADEIFGYDCLGLVGNYLYWAGLQSHYPEYNQEQYIRLLRLRAAENADDIVPLSILLWLGLATQHIAIVDRVLSVDGPHVHVDICQSSAGGPQVNQRVRLTRTMTTFAAAGSTMREFRISQLGTPAMPVSGRVVVVSNPNWQLVRPGSSPAS